MASGVTTAGFSRLAPGTHIKPHVGYTSEVLRCHLGLIVPPDCALRVGSETRRWEEKSLSRLRRYPGSTRPGTGRTGTGSFCFWTS